MNEENNNSAYKAAMQTYAYAVVAFSDTSI